MHRSTLARHRFQRTSAEGGGGGNPPAGGNPAEPPKTDPPADPPKNDPPKAEDKGFPENTPVAEMTYQQQAAYWRNQSKVQQQRADAVKDYDTIKADAEKWREYQKAQQTPAEKQIEQAKLEAKREVAGDSAMGSLRAILSSRGKNDKELSDLLDFVDPSRFVTEAGQVDHQKVTAYADKLVPVRSAGGQDFGQGRHTPTGQSARDAGKAEAQRRFGNKTTS